MKTILYTLFAAIGFTLATNSQAQCDTLASRCQKHIEENYISDGQTYRALLTGDDTAEFQSVFFEGNTYRIAACSGDSENNLIFRIVDQDRNIMFTNRDYSTAPFWDFYIENTIPVTIEAMLDPNKSVSGCAVLVIGFKK